jgi:hypothetical protein
LRLVTATKNLLSSKKSVTVRFRVAKCGHRLGKPSLLNTMPR